MTKLKKPKLQFLKWSIPSFARLNPDCSQTKPNPKRTSTIINAQHKHHFHSFQGNTQRHALISGVSTIRWSLRPSTAPGAWLTHAFGNIHIDHAVEKKKERKTLPNLTSLSKKTRPISSYHHCSELLDFKGGLHWLAGSEGVVAAHAVLVASLDVVIEPVQLLPVLGHHRAHDVADGDHPQHPRAVDHRDVSDAVFCADDWHSGS